MAKIILKRCALLLSLWLSITQAVTVFVIQPVSADETRRPTELELKVSYCLGWFKIMVPENGCQIYSEEYSKQVCLSADSKIKRLILYLVSSGALDTDAIFAAAQAQNDFNECLTDMANKVRSGQTPELQCHKADACKDIEKLLPH